MSVRQRSYLTGFLFCVALLISCGKEADTTRAISDKVAEVSAAPQEFTIKEYISEEGYPVTLIKGQGITTTIFKLENGVEFVQSNYAETGEQKEFYRKQYFKTVDTFYVNTQVATEILVADSLEALQHKIAVRNGEVPPNSDADAKTKVANTE